MAQGQNLHPMLRLQHAVGNQAVLGLLRGGVLQRKLAVGAPGDIYEQEAERVAAEGSRTEPGPVVQRRCACGGIPGPDGECATCRAKWLARQHRPASPTGSAVAPPIVGEVLRSPGQPLDTETRVFFEQRFRHDFSGVRLHTDGRATESARSVNALAYTVGNNIVFGENRYRPDAHEGRLLIAHELTHVIQQEGLGKPPRQNLTLGPPHDPHEEEADQIASLVANAAVSDLAGYVRKTTPVASGRLGRHEPWSSFMIQRQVPTGITLKENKPFGHADLKSDEDKKKFRTYIGAVTLMQLTPPGDYTAGQKKGECTREFLTEVSNTCPSHEFCGKERCLEVARYGTAGDPRTGKEVTDGPDTFIDRHISTMETSFLESSGKSDCSVVCHQHYKYRTEPDKKYHDLASFYIIRNFRAGTYKPSGSKDALAITTGEVRKVPAQLEAPTKEKFAKDISPGLKKSGVLP